MIAFLQGKLVYKSGDFLVLNVGGVGYKVFVPASTLAGVSPSGEETIRVHTYLHVREDAMVLYGFTERDELRLFENLINVSGVGPKGALGILSAGSVSYLNQAIIGENLVLLTKIQGIGKKTAQRIIIELKDKLAKESLDYSPGPIGGVVSGPNEKGQEAVEALQALGYSQGEALRAVQKVLTGEDCPGRIEEVIRLALKELARI